MSAMAIGITPSAISSSAGSHSRAIIRLRSGLDPANVGMEASSGDNAIACNRRRRVSPEKGGKSDISVYEAHRSTARRMRKNAHWNTINLFENVAAPQPCRSALGYHFAATYGKQ